MEDIKRDTVGAIASELMVKEPETRDPIEIQREVHKKEFEENILETIRRKKTGKGYALPTEPYDGPFYVVVVTKRERLMPNVLRNYFFTTNACPTPTWDQTVYRYTPHDEKIEYLWTVPDKETCRLLKDNALIVAQEERQLLSMVLDFTDGTLDRKARLYNGEIDA